MANNRHHDKQLTQNQNNRMSEDPGDGNRNSDRLGAVEKTKGLRGAPEKEAQHGQEALEVFGEEGAGVDSKE